MVNIIFKDGFYNGVNREIIQGETIIELPSYPSGLEKIYENEVISFDKKPYYFTEDEILKYKEKAVTNQTFCYNSTIVASTPDNKEITDLVLTHLSRDGFILEPGAMLVVDTTLKEKTIYIKLKLTGSYTTELDVTAMVGEQEVALSSLNELIVSSPSDKLSIIIENPTDKLIVLNELIYMY